MWLGPLGSFHVFERRVDATRVRRALFTSVEREKHFRDDGIEALLIPDGALIEGVQVPAHSANQLRETGVVASIWQLIRNDAPKSGQVHRHDDTGDVRRDERLSRGFVVVESLGMLPLRSVELFAACRLRP